MIDMNDPEVIESLKFLLVPKEEKIRLAAQPYSSTKNFFVPCKEEGYECAVITKEDGDNITLETRKNKVSQCFSRWLQLPEGTTNDKFGLNLCFLLDRHIQKRPVVADEPAQVRDVR